MLLHTNLGDIEIFVGDCANIAMESGDSDYIEIIFDCTIDSEKFLKEVEVNRKAGINKEFEESRPRLIKRGYKSPEDIYADTRIIEIGKCVRFYLRNNRLMGTVTVMFSDPDWELCDYHVCVPVDIYDDPKILKDFVFDVLQKKYDRIFAESPA